MEIFCNIINYFPFDHFIESLLNKSANLFDKKITLTLNLNSIYCIWIICVFLFSVKVSGTNWWLVMGMRLTPCLWTGGKMEDKPEKLW